MARSPDCSATVQCVVKIVAIEKTAEVPGPSCYICGNFLRFARSCPTACRTVVEVGEGVQKLKVGDRVALEPGIPCWSNPAPRWALSQGHGSRTCISADADVQHCLARSCGTTVHMSYGVPPSCTGSILRRDGMLTLV